MFIFRFWENCFWSLTDCVIELYHRWKALMVQPHSSVNVEVETDWIIFYKNKPLDWPHMNFTWPRFKTVAFQTKDTHFVESVHEFRYCTWTLNSSAFWQFVLFFQLLAVWHLHDGSHVHVSDFIKKMWLQTMSCTSLHHSCL